MNLLDKFHFKDKKTGNTTTMEICDSFSRSKIAQILGMIPTKTSQLENDSGFITSAAVPTKTSQLENDSGFTTFSGNYNDLTNKPTIPTKTSQLENDTGFTTFSGNYNDLSNKPSIPVISANYDAPFTKLRIGDKAIVYGTVGSQSIAVTSQYVANVAYFADVNISIPAQARLSALASVSVQTINGLGLLAVDILEQEVDHIKVRLFSPKAESITLGFSVIIMGNN